MSVTYTYQETRNRLNTACAGDVRLVDVVNHFHFLSLDPGIRAGVDVLLDLTELTSSPDPEHYDTLLETMRRVTARRPFGRCAVVATRDSTDAVARGFVDAAGQHFSQTHVFRDRSAATAWLDQTVSLQRPA